MRDELPIKALIAAYVTQMQRAFHQGTRGIATPEQREAWQREAAAAINAVAARAWDQGWRHGSGVFARLVPRGNPYRPEATNPYRPEADR